jgi:hypothetical protein
MSFTKIRRQLEREAAEKAHREKHAAMIEFGRFAPLCDLSNCPQDMLTALYHTPVLTADSRTDEVLMISPRVEQPARADQ